MPAIQQIAAGPNLGDYLLLVVNTLMRIFGRKGNVVARAIDNVADESLVNPTIPMRAFGRG